MYPRKSLTKATIEDFDGKKPKIDFEFMLNPSDISIERGCGFEASQGEPSVRRDYGPLKFSGGKADQLSMSFIMDATEPSLTDPKNALLMMSPIIVSSPTMATAKEAKMIPTLQGCVEDGTDLRDKLNQLVVMTKLSTEASKSVEGDKPDATIYPRLLKFKWGEFIEFAGAIEKLSFKITLFDSDGAPMRAEVEMGMVGIFGKDVKIDDLVWGTSKSTASSEKAFG